MNRLRERERISSLMGKFQREAPKECISDRFTIRRIDEHSGEWSHDKKNKTIWNALVEQGKSAEGIDRRQPDSQTVCTRRTLEGRGRRDQRAEKSENGRRNERYPIGGERRALKSAQVLHAAVVNERARSRHPHEHAAHIHSCSFMLHIYSPYRGRTFGAGP